MIKGEDRKGNKNPRVSEGERENETMTDQSNESGKRMYKRDKEN